MSFFPEVQMADSFPPFAAFRESFGLVPNLFRAQTLLPRVIEAEAQIAGTVLLKEAGLTRVQKECILLAISSAKGNTYCATSHTEFLRRLGEPDGRLEQIARDHRRAELSESDKALLDFALKLSQYPTAIGLGDYEALRGKGFSDEQILEAILMAGLTHFLCTLSIGLGAVPDFEPVKLSPIARAAFREATRSLTQEHAPYLPAIERSPEEFAPFAFFKEKFGFVPNIFRAQTLRPDVVEAEANVVGAILLTDDVLARKQKEYILLVISAANLNTYCVAVHCEMLRALGIPVEESDQIAIDHHQADLSNADQALLDFALKLAKHPKEFGGEDIKSLRKHGFTEEQILEAVVMTALTDFLNTLQMGLGTVTDFEPRLVFPLKEVNLSNAMSRPMIEGLGAPTPPSEADDADAAAVASVKSGQIDAFEELVRRNTRRVYRTLMGVLNDADDAEDAVQEVFLKAFAHLADFKGKSKFSTWLVRIAINTGVQQLRKRRGLESFSESSDDEETFRPRLIRAWQDDPEQLYSKTEMRELVEKALTKLPVKYRVVLMLRDIEEFSTREAATALNLGLPALKARLLRGRLMLREELAPYFVQKGAVSV
jgi:RNA polymerase sigma-70 factor (ECF subfamily)